VGNRPVGGAHLVAVQTMTKTKTHDVPGTLKQIQGAQDKGVDIVRVACPDEKSAAALPAIIEGSRVPIIADIHFAPGLAIKALEAGVHCVLDTFRAGGRYSAKFRAGARSISRSTFSGRATA
jgi:(E)-4-hydroxy-3-methylbut-2-enyl-diphosphate synthase